MGGSWGLARQSWAPSSPAFLPLLPGAWAAKLTGGRESPGSRRSGLQGGLGPHRLRYRVPPGDAELTPSPTSPWPPTRVLRRGCCTCWGAPGEEAHVKGAGLVARGRRQVMLMSHMRPGSRTIRPPPDAYADVHQEQLLLQRKRGDDNKEQSSCPSHICSRSRPRAKHLVLTASCGAPGSPVQWTCGCPASSGK